MNYVDCIRGGGGGDETDRSLCYKKCYFFNMSQLIMGKHLKSCRS